MRRSTRLLELLADDGAPRVEGVYMHIPFCFHKCHYCDFYSIVDRRDRQQAFTQRMIEEIRAAGRRVGGPVRTIFVGGGTPTLLRPELWRDLLEAVHRTFDLSRLQEFTVEANPETVSSELMKVLARGGVNRISIGAQSFDRHHLATLERHHEPANVARAAELAREAGIANINLDLIFAIPGQTEPQWLSDLRQALELRPDHLSCYALTYEPNTPMTQKLDMGRLDRCDELREARMYRATIRTLRRAGYEHYEISNFASPGRQCLHNLLYWTSGSHLALGPGAAGHIAGVRWKNIPHLGRYLKSGEGGGVEADGGAEVEGVERLDPDGALGEQLMLRLRLIQGVERGWLEPRLKGSRREVMHRQIEQGLLERTPTHVRLSEKGLMLADSVIGDLL